MPAIPLTPVQAAQMADDWLALRPLWDEVAEPDRAAAMAYFQLPETTLFNADRAQLVAAYEGSDTDFSALLQSDGGDFITQEDGSLILIGSSN